MENIRRIVMEAVRRAIREAVYDVGDFPIHSNGDIGRNPLAVDNGGHASQDKITQASTVDAWGASFQPKEIKHLMPNQWIIYKVKNFGNPDITGTRSIFANGKEIRRAIDLVNGSAGRNGRGVTWRVVVDGDKSREALMSGYMSNAFWEFSLDGGYEWYILKPDPVQRLKKSSIK